MRIGIPAETQRRAVKACRIEVEAKLIRLAACESRCFEFPITFDKAKRDDAERDVRGIEPVMRDRCARVVFTGRTMHEGGRSERRLTGIAEIDECTSVLRQAA